MRRLACLFIIGCLASAQAADAPDPDKFTEALKQAIMEQDEKTLQSFADDEGLSEEGQERQKLSVKKMFPSADVFSVSLGPLPVDFPMSFIMNGYLFEPTHPPEGIITVSFRQESGLTSRQYVYAVVDGKYKIVATKRKSLNWKGPPDTNLGFILEGDGAEAAVTTVRINASGVDVERVIHGASINMWGQHFNGIEVESKDPNANLTLKVIRDGKEIYKSEILKGAGKIIYAGDKPQALKKE